MRGFQYVVHELPSPAEPLNVVTIENPERRRSMCRGCPAICCQSALAPSVSQEEYLTRRFKITYIPLPAWMVRENPEMQPTYKMAVIAGTENGCYYFNRETGQCRLWPNLPDACFAYDCREDDREPVATFARERAKTWEQ